MFLVAGVNGSGKSSFTRNIIRKEPTLTVIDPDAIAKGMTGSYAPVETKALSAGKVALMQVQNCINSNQSFIVESTISGRVYLRYLDQAKAAGFKCILIYVALESPELSAQRVAARVARGGHNIPTHDIKRRYPKSFKNLKMHLRPCELAYIYDNSKHYKLIVSYRNGLIYRSNELPSFIKPYL
jgi:predicted ABC-type ATPase